MGVIVHLWSHPHNFIDGDQMDILMDKVLELAGNAVKRGDIVNYTQHEYAEHILRGK